MEVLIVFVRETHVFISVINRDKLMCLVVAGEIDLRKNDIELKIYFDRHGILSVDKVQLHLSI